jgi:hypothetical protein
MSLVQSPKTTKTENASFRPKSLKPVIGYSPNPYEDDFNSEKMFTANSRFYGDKNEADERDTQPAPMSDQALEAFFALKIQEIEREFEDVYKTRLNKYCEEFIRKEEHYQFEIERLRSQLEKKSNFLSANLKGTYTIPEEEIDYSKMDDDEKEEYLQRLEEETENILFRKGLDDSEVITEKETRPKSKSREKRPSGSSANAKERLKVVNEKIKTENLKLNLEQDIRSSVEGEMQLLRREINDKNVQIGRLKSIINIKIKSLTDSKKDLEAQLESERQTHDKKVRTIELENQQLKELNSRLNAENSASRAKIEKLETDNRLLEATNKSLQQINQSQNQKEVKSVAKSPEIKVKDTDSQDRVTVKNQELVKGARIARAFSEKRSGTENILQLPGKQTSMMVESTVQHYSRTNQLPFSECANLTDLIFSMNPDNEASNQHGTNGTSKPNRRPRKSLKSGISNHSMSPDIKQENTQQMNNRDGLSRKTRSSIKKSSAFVSKQVVETDQNKPHSNETANMKSGVTNFLQKYKKIAREVKRNTLTTSPNKEYLIIQYFEVPFDEDSTSDREVKIFRNKIEKSVEADDEKMNAYLQLEFYFLNNHLKSILGSISNSVIRTNVSRDLKEVVKDVSKLWKNMYVSYGDRIHFFEQLIALENISDLKTQLDRYSDDLSAIYSQTKSIFDLLQSRDQKKNAIYKLARCLNDLNVFYQKSFHAWKSLQKIVEKLEEANLGLERGVSIYYKGIELCYLIELDNWEVDYLQRMKIRTEIRNKIANSKGF